MIKAFTKLLKFIEKYMEDKINFKNVYMREKVQILYEKEYLLKI